MAKNRYVLEFEDDFFDLKVIGITSQLSNHQLVYELNEFLQSSFVRNRDDLVSDGLFFPYFVWKKEDEYVYLIDNKSNSLEENISNELFSFVENPVFLVPELGKATHLIVASSQWASEINSCLEYMNSPKRSYFVDVNSLKLKHKLIF